MKFSKEDLSKAIKAKMTANGESVAMSDRTISALVDSIYSLGVNEETELDAFTEQVLPTFKSMEGQYRHDNSDFIKKWKEDHKEPTPPVEPNPKPAPTKDDKLDLLMKQIQELKDEQAATKRTNAITAKKAEMLAKLKEKGLKDKEWANNYLNEINVDENTDVDAKVESAMKLFNLSSSHVNPNLTPGGAGGSGNQKEDHAFDDIVARRTRE